MLDLFFRKYAWAANLVLLFAAAWLSAKTVNTLVGAAIRPRPAADLSTPVAAPRPAAPVALDPDDLYRLIGQTPPAPVAEAAAGEAPRRAQTCDDPRAEPVRTGLRLQLVATVLADHPQWSLATITDLSSRETRVVGVGDEIGGARVLGVERIAQGGDATGNAFKVVAVICNDGAKEFLEMEPDAAGAEPAPNLGVAALPRGRAAKGAPVEGVRPVGENRYEIDRSVIDNALGDMSRLATQARIVPSFKNGVANGFKLFAIQPGSLYSAIGVQNGDVIQRINGFEINSPEKALELYQRLKESSHVTIDLERGGQTVKKEYTIGGSP